jgi:uncharacterized glyoxalase superfamily protein PhnB
MKSNIFPTLRYRDADAAIAWLKDAFGFEEIGARRRRFAGGDLRRARGR